MMTYPARTTMLEAVAGAAQIAPVLREVLTRRMGWSHLGDSHLIFGGGGVDHAWRAVCARRWPAWSVGLHSAGENDGSGYGTGLGMSDVDNGVQQGVFSEPGREDPTLAPADWQPLLLTDGPAPLQAVYRHTSAAALNTGRGMFIVSASHFPNLLDRRQALTATAWHVQSPSGGSGQWRVAVRHNNGLIAGTSTLLTSNHTALRVVATDIAVPASNARTGVVGLQFNSIEFNTALTAPWALLCQELHSPERLTGWRTSNLVYRGGADMTAWIAWMQARATAYWDWVFSALRRNQVAQHGSAREIFVVTFGHNERTNVTPSAGPSPAPSNTAAGVRDNLTGIRNFLRTRWNAVGGDFDAECAVLCMMVQETGSTPSLNAVRQGALDFVAGTPRAALVDWSRLLPWSEFDSAIGRRWWAATNDSTHLSTQGYDVICERALAALLLACGMEHVAGASLAPRGAQGLTKRRR